MEFLAFIFQIGLSGVAFLSAFEFFRLFLRKLKNTPPRPWGLPIIGHFLLLGSLLHRSLYNLSKKYGPIIMIEAGSAAIIVVSSAELAKEFFTTHDITFASRPKLATVKHLTYNARNIGWADYGSYWRQMKKVCTVELLTAKRIAESKGIRFDELLLFLESIMVEGAKGNVQFNITPKLAVLAMNVTTRMVISQKLHENSSEELLRAVQEVQVLFGAFNLVDCFPVLTWLDPQGYIKRSKQLHKQLDGTLRKIIDEHREQKTGRPLDLVDILLSQGFDDEPICAIVLDMILGGTETSSLTAEWALSELINNPETMLKAQEEMDTVVGKDRLVTESDLDNLKYLKAIVKETFRLRPVAPLLLPHQSTEECKVSGYSIPKNSRLLINIWAIGQDPSLWESPEKFNPERFLGSSIDVKGQDFELIPFGSGRRMCPGISLGLCMVELMLAHCLQGFQWRTVDGQPVNMEEQQGTTIHRKFPLNVFATPRLPHHLYSHTQL